MKKALSIISSAALSLALVAPAAAGPQIAKKASSPKAKSSSVAKTAVKPQGKKLEQNSRVQLVSKRTPDVLSNGLKQASTGLLRLNKGRKAPVKFAENASIPTLYGSVIYNDTFTQDVAPVGLYSFDGNVGDLVALGADASSGGVEVDGIYYCVNYYSFWGYVFVTNCAYSVEDGTLIASQDGQIDNIYAGGMTLDPTTGTVYAIGYNSAGNALQLSTVDLSEDATMVTNPIADIAGNWNSIVCDAQGQLYGISYVGQTVGESFEVISSTLCKIDKSNGAVTEIGNTGQIPQYISSAAIDPKSGRMFWNVLTPDGEGYLCEVNLETGAATPIFQFAYNDEIMGMYVPAPAAEDGAPAAVTDLAANFVDGSLTGNISFTSPETLFDGTIGTGDLSYKVLANGELVAEGASSFGAEVNQTLTMSAAGDYKFVVTVANEVGESPKAKVSCFVGNGIPAAPAASLVYEDGMMHLTWTAVTASADGGYLNPEEVTYTVTRFPEEVVVAENIKETSFTEPYAEDSNAKVYYTVVASFAGLNSAVATSNAVKLGNVVPPYYNPLVNEGDLDDFTILNVNGDAYTWVVSPSGTYVHWNSNEAMDDWMISPAFKLEGGNIYQLSFQTRGQSASYAERFEVKYGKMATVEGLDKVLVAPTEIKTNVYGEVTAFITPEESGNYFIGIHAMSDKDTYYLYVKDFSLSGEIIGTVPGKVTDLEIYNNPSDDLQATVSFNAPSVNYVGDALSSITSIVVKRDGEVVKTVENPEVGAAVSVDDTVPASGNYTYSVQAINADGEGPEVSAEAYVGVERPAAPESATIAEEGNTGYVTINWTPVTEDINGNPLAADKITYIVAVRGSMGWEALAENLTGTSYSYQAVEEGEQDFVQCGVFAVTEGGNTGTSTDMIAVGTPYDGMEESFEDGSIHYIWGTGFAENGGAWQILDDEQFSDVSSCDGDNGFAAMKGQYLDSSAALFSGKISLEGMTNPGVSFYTYNIVGDSPDINEIQLYVMESGTEDWVELGDATVIDEINPGETGWQKVIVSLEAYAGKTIQVRFQATVKQYQWTMIDQVKVGSQRAFDLTAKGINAPAFVANGAEYNVNVVVANNGVQAVVSDQEATEADPNPTAYNVNLFTAEGELIATKPMTNLAAGATATATFVMTMSPVAEEPVGYYAEVQYAADENAEDNKTETIYVAPKASNLPVVTDLAAVFENDAITLTWSEPDLSNAPKEGALVDFEDANAWAMEYAGWTFVDMDESPVGGMQNTDIPAITVGESTASFFVFDNSGDQFNQSFDAHSGTMFLAAMFRYDDGTTDDWAISPELSGDAQTISFWARSYSINYPEKIEMLYSMGSIDTADFELVQTVASVPGDWTEYTFDVPAGAKYFAIRSCATGSFMLMMDDFTFAAAEGASAELSIIGYDIYRDGVKINEEPVGETEFVDNNVVDGETYTYQVIAVYDRGISAPASILVATTGVNSIVGGVKVASAKGMILVNGAAELNLSVVAADGKVIYNAVASDSEAINVPAGVYVVRAGNKTVKVAVK